MTTDPAAASWPSSPSPKASWDPACPHLVTVCVREIVEWEIEVDTTKPDWSWLAETTEDPDEWVAALDDCASETEGAVERAIRAGSPSDAWREVEYL